MNKENTFHKILDWFIPINSNRRMAVRLLKQIYRSPVTVKRRINCINISNFLRYRNYEFHCPICGHETTPLYDFPDIELRRLHMIGILRETLQCRMCFGSLRQRSLALALLNYLAHRNSVNYDSIATLAAVGLGEVRLLDTDNFSAISQLLREVPGYVRCSYLPDRPWGEEIEPNYFNINLEKIDFSDASFDIVITSDVMEHVRNSDAAHAEIERVLTTDGAYIFNVPFDEGSQNDILLVDTSEKENRYLCEPQFHGDPLTGGILAYRVFGRHLITELSDLGFEVDFFRIEQPASLVVDGDVFVAMKKVH